ncbi:VOC family protein [Planobispora rosea]|uniref:VOC family protein n=1 Tax=Planobispora rosea TaxID=35762 RepID=UPI00083AA481|nr:VOC family protein [Planobispora rosea]
MVSVRIGTAFVPVTDIEESARWYGDMFGFRIMSVDGWSTVLSPQADHGARLTLLGPASGIPVSAGLPWATCNLVVDDLAKARLLLESHGCEVGEITGAPDVCLFFTTRDPDGNTVLVCDR